MKRRAVTAVSTLAYIVSPVLAVSVVARHAQADEVPAPAAPTASSIESGAGADAVPAMELEMPLVDVRTMEERVAQAEQLARASQPSLTWGGYVDFGFFVPQGSDFFLGTRGNGAGYIQDLDHARFPEYMGRFGWVFLGDILSPAVNSRGEVTDLGDAPGVDRFDSINSRGAPGFILNELNLTVRTALTPHAIVSASVNLTPRTGNDFRLGDVFDVDLAQIEWLPSESQRTSIFVGKTDSVLGIEYRDRKSDRRFGITPSLIARYTTGTALGLKVRSKFGSNDWLVLAAALTNGSNTTEQFHFYDEVDSNRGKTVSGRMGIKLPFRTEVGLSGSYGAQDRALSSDRPMWFYGADLQAHLGAVEVKAQWLTGHADGADAEDVYGLDLHAGGYLELNTMIGSSLGVITRGEYRDAFVWLGTERAYLTKSWRATVGLRYVITARAVVKAEYLKNGEYGGLPAVSNDVFTTSLVLGL